MLQLRTPQTLNTAQNHCKSHIFAAPEVRPDLILHFGWQWVGPQSPPVDMMCCWHHFLLLQQEQSTRARLTHWHIAIIQSAITRNEIPQMKGKAVFCVWPGAQELWSTGAHLCDTNPPSVTDAHTDSAYGPHHTHRWVLQECIIALDVFFLRQQGKQSLSWKKSIFYSKSISSAHVITISYSSLQNFICPGHRINRFISLFSPFFVLLHHPNLMLNAPLLTLLLIPRGNFHNCILYLFVLLFWGRKSHYPLMHKKSTAMLKLSQLSQDAGAYFEMLWA